MLAELRQRGAGLPECGGLRPAECRARMRYLDCLRSGLPIGPGMRWTVAGANPVLWLRRARLGDWFDDYWDDRLAA